MSAQWVEWMVHDCEFRHACVSPRSVMRDGVQIQGLGAAEMWRRARDAAAELGEAQAREESTSRLGPWVGVWGIGCCWMSSVAL